MLASPSSTSALTASSSPYLHVYNKIINFFFHLRELHTSMRSGEEPMSLCPSHLDPCPAGGSDGHPHHLPHSKTCELDTSPSNQEACGHGKINEVGDYCSTVMFNGVIYPSPLTCRIHFPFLCPTAS